MSGMMPVNYHSAKTTRQRPASIVCLCLLNAHMLRMGVAKALARLLKCAYSSELSLLANAIKTTVDCLSMSSKCTYVLNGCIKGSGETAQVRRLV